MEHRLFAVLASVGFALEGAGCASESQRARQEEILMPLQTGSTLQRRIMTDSGSVTEKPKKKDSKRNSAKPPAPTPEPSPPRPEEESTTPPDRFR